MFGWPKFIGMEAIDIFFLNTANVLLMLTILMTSKVEILIV